MLNVDFSFAIAIAKDMRRDGRPREIRGKSEENAMSRTMEKAAATAKPEKWQNKQIK